MGRRDIYSNIITARIVLIREGRRDGGGGLCICGPLKPSCNVVNGNNPPHSPSPVPSPLVNPSKHKPNPTMTLSSRELGKNAVFQGSEFGRGVVSIGLYFKRMVSLIGVGGHGLLGMGMERLVCIAVYLP